MKRNCRRCGTVTREGVDWDTVKELDLNAGFAFGFDQRTPADPCFEPTLR